MAEQPEGEAFDQLVRGYLEPHTEALVSVLTQLINYPYVPQVKHLAFEIFCEGFTQGFPMRVFFLDETYTEYFLYEGDKARYPCTVDPGLLSLDRVYPREVEEAYEVDLEGDDPGFDYMTAAGLTAAAWLEECWQQAGGASFTRDASVGLHDGDARYDLMRKQIWK